MDRSEVWAVKDLAGLEPLQHDQLQQDKKQLVTHQEASDIGLEPTLRVRYQQNQAE